MNESNLDLRDYEYKEIERVETPEVFKLDVSTLTVKNQGTVNSCVAHALSSLLEYFYKTVYSVGFIYGYRPEGYYQGCGMSLRDGLKTIYNVGAIENEYFDYNLEMQEIKELVSKDLVKLDMLKDDVVIDSFGKLKNIEEIKSWIYKYKLPVPILVPTTELELVDNIIQIPRMYSNAGHCMLVVGWNELGLLVLNSWGIDWGNKGYAILPYEFDIKESFKLEDIENFINSNSNNISTFLDILKTLFALG